METINKQEYSKKEKNLLLLRVYFLTSLFTFTGGIAMLSTLKKEICDKYKLMDAKDFYNYAAISQTLPGVIALNNACFVGKKINGKTGMFVASFAAILPAFVFMLIATILFQLIPKDGPIYYSLSAIRAISAAFIFSAALTIARLNIKNLMHIAIALICFIGVTFSLLGALWLILISIFLGFIIAFKRKKSEVKDLDI